MPAPPASEGRPARRRSGGWVSGADGLAVAAPLPRPRLGRGVGGGGGRLGVAGPRARLDVGEPQPLVVVGERLPVAPGAGLGLEGGRSRSVRRSKASCPA